MSLRRTVPLRLRKQIGLIWSDNHLLTVIDGLEDLLKEQKAIGRNLNQLTTLCNMGKIICPDLRELKEQYAEVMTVLNRITGRCG